MCNYDFDPEDWEKGWEMDADEAEDFIDQLLIIAIKRDV